MAFTDKMKQYTGDQTGLDTANALKQGVDYTLGMAKQLSPSQWFGFANKVGVKTAMGVGYNIREEDVYDLIKVRRHNGTDFIDCRPVMADQALQLSDPKSIYYADNTSPAYYMTYDGYIKILPETGSVSALQGELYVVFSSRKKTINDTNETIKDNSYTSFGQSFVSAERFPNHWKQMVILHASEVLLIEKLSDFNAKLPTDLDADTTVFDQIGDLDIGITYTFPSSEVGDALSKAQHLIDKKASIGDDGSPLSVQEWLEDEDEDMVASTLSVAAQELQRANAILGEFNAEINAKVTDKSQELQEYQANLQKKMSLYDKIISRLNVDYGWVTAQLQQIQQKKQEFQQVITSAGISDNPEETTI
jgi:hypothetical protein